jgi:hypothetical protein
MVRPLCTDDVLSFCLSEIKHMTKTILKDSMFGLFQNILLVLG